MKRFEPCLPRPAKQPPASKGWIHEIKRDGFRIAGSWRDGDDVRLLSRKAAALDAVLMLLAFGASEHFRIRRK